MGFRLKGGPALLLEWAPYSSGGSAGLHSSFNYCCYQGARAFTFPLRFGLSPARGLSCSISVSSSNMSGYMAEWHPLSAGVLFSGVFWYLQLEPPPSLPSLFPGLGMFSLTHAGLNHTGITSQLMSTRDDMCPWQWRVLCIFSNLACNSGISKGTISFENVYEVDGPAPPFGGAGESSFQGQVFWTGLGFPSHLSECALAVFSLANMFCSGVLCSIFALTQRGYSAPFHWFPPPLFGKQNKNTYKGIYLCSRLYYMCEEDDRGVYHPKAKFSVLGIIYFCS